MLNVSDYSVAYGQSEILRKMNFSVGNNEIVAIMGRNGMGKTTLMKSLMGVIPSQGGSVNLDGKEITGLKSHERVKAGFGFVPQGR
ncbi:MAG TPA: ATP-binding cassette domain-containing protein, partial [Porticoccaceae bacterium]|nr:ATP-binding cassette domain-containing protein [Porticoccaceae bacterium]